MFKKTTKLLGLFLLLTLSFIYTDKVFSGVRQNDPLMKEVLNYKKDFDKKPTEPIISEDELILGYSGIIVNEEESYKKMKDVNKFDKEKMVYEKKLPDITITKNYDYYIKQGNPSKKEVALVFKVKDDTNLDTFLSTVAKNNVNVTFFLDGKWLEENIETAFSIVNMQSEIYNLGYEGKYTKENISITNNLIESISLKDSKFCYNEEKDDDYKKICKSKKMYSIIPSLNNPNVTDLKEGLTKGAIVAYDLDEFDISQFKLILNTITSRGYKVQSLSNLIKES